MASSKNIEQSEVPAKVWQIEALAEKIDGLSKSQDELKQLIIAQTNTYPTKTELALELEKRDNRIKSLEKTMANYAKVIWTVVSAVIPTVALSIWQLIINAGRLQ